MGVEGLKFPQPELYGEFRFGRYILANVPLTFSRWSNRSSKIKWDGIDRARDIEGWEKWEARSERLEWDNTHTHTHTHRTCNPTHGGCESCTTASLWNQTARRSGGNYLKHNRSGVPQCPGILKNANLYAPLTARTCPSETSF